MAIDDPYTISLLHFDGANASTTFTDEAGRTWTPYGGAKLDTTISSPLNNGLSTGLFNGTTDYLSAPDSADWVLDGGSNSNAWTVDFWVRFTTDPSATAAGFIQQWVSATNYWGIFFNVGTLVCRACVGGINVINISQTWTPAINTWYHVAVVKNGTTGYLFFINGTQIGTTVTNTTLLPDLAAVMWVARMATTSSFYLNGRMEELRISKGIARWTANFTPPTIEYAPANGNFFLMF